MARVQVVMPQMGESIVEGTIVEWLKKVGDTVELDEDVFTLSTDKVDAEVPAPAAGILVEVLANVGDTVAVNEPVAVIETDVAAAKAGGKSPAAAPAKSDAPAPAAAAPVPAAKTSVPAADVPAPAAPAEASAPSAASTPAPARAASIAEPPAPSETEEELRARRSTPVVRKIAAEHGIDDLSEIEGSGAGGRVTKKDILAFIERGGPAEPEAPAPAAAEKQPSAVVPPRAAPVLPSSTAGIQPAFVKPPRVHVFDNDRVEPMSRMRASIAENMLQARRGTAHCHTVWEADVTRIVKARKGLQAEFDKRGVKLTYTPFFVSAVVDGLRQFPLLNAAIDGDSIVHRGDMNIGVAAAIDEGLIVPVLKNADTLNLFGIAKGVNDLGERARTRKLKPQDVADGTFTISNAGIWGSLFGIPILVQPQVGILGIGGIKKRVIADDDDNIRVRSIVTMCLSFDHRLIDGATADGFMSFVTGRLSNWE